MTAMSDETLTALSHFVAVADQGSFEGAAKTLRADPDALRRSFEALEQELNVTLALRTERTVRLTRDGKATYRAAQATLSAMPLLPLGECAMVRPGPAPLTGPVALVLPTELAIHWLPSRLARLKRGHPDLITVINADDEAPALRDSDFDIAVRTAYQLPNLRVGGETLRLMLAARHAPTVDVDRHGVYLRDATLLSGAFAEVAVARDPGSGRVRPLHADRGTCVNNREAAIAMARAGLGVVLATENALAHDLSTGTLEPVLPDWDFGSIALTIALRDEVPTESARAVAAALQPPATNASLGALFSS